MKLAKSLAITDAHSLYSWMEKNLTYEGKVKGYLRTPEKLITDKKAHCWESSEFERQILKELGFQPIVFYLENKDCTATHTAVAYEDRGKFYWLEWAWGKNAGIHHYASLDDLIDQVRITFLKEYGSLAVFTKSGNRVLTDGDNESSCVGRMRDWVSVAGMNGFDNYSILKTSKANVDFFKGIYPGLRTVRTGKDYFGELIIDLIEMTFVAVLQCSNYHYIIALEVNPKHRGKGIATRLLKTAVTQYDNDHLTVNKANKTAIDLYLKHGWTITKENNHMLYMVHRPKQVSTEAMAFLKW